MYEHTARRPKGYVEITCGDGTRIEGDTLQCTHCGCHWVVQPGSGIQRGWCLNCGGPTCGSRQCDVCVPLEKQIEMMEAKR